MCCPFMLSLCFTWRKRKRDNLENTPPKTDDTIKVEESNDTYIVARQMQEIHRLRIELEEYKRIFGEYESY